MSKPFSPLSRHVIKGDDGRIRQRPRYSTIRANEIDRRAHSNRRTNPGNPKGRRIYTEHPQGLNMRQAWASLFELNEIPANRFDDTALLQQMIEWFPTQQAGLIKQGVRAIGRHRYLYNYGHLVGSPKVTSHRWVLALRSGKPDPKATLPWLATQKGKPILLLGFLGREAIPKDMVKKINMNPNVKCKPRDPEPAEPELLDEDDPRLDLQP